MVKQVIVIRRDLNMRRGKEIAQGSHASMAFLTTRILRCLKNIWHLWRLVTIRLSAAEIQWILNSFAKICCQVSSKKELLAVYETAKAAGLEAHLIVDSGKTEFNGIPTETCIAIGPDHAERLDPITGHLKLY
jgi:PTH2 family peptidyl-tRNA hydrolase